jgi:ubiquinone biosynthesis protein Coq4
VKLNTETWAESVKHHPLGKFAVEWDDLKKKDVNALKRCLEHATPLVCV